MLAILPLLSLMLIIPVIHQFGSYGWRVSILFGLVIWGGVIALLTEILSLFQSIHFYAILIAWVVILIILLLGIIFGTRRYDLGQLKLAFASIPDFEFFLVTTVLLLMFVTGFICLIYPPNNVDSMTYHMSRVMHWMQNRSVEFYPTSNLRQLHQSPWSEFAILHLQVLNNGDLFANSIQWLCMAGYIVGVTLIAQELGASRRGQIFTAAVCATIPMGVLQGTTTQTDGAVAYWLVCFVYFVMLLRKQPNLFYAIGAGLALSLSILTKATAYIYVFPFLIWLVISLFKHKAPKKWLILSIIALITIVINSGDYLRNYELYHNPLGPRKEEEWGTYANELYSPASLTSNVIRNLSLHFGTPIDQVNQRIEQVVGFIHELIDLSPNDKRTTWWKTPFTVQRFIPQEDSAGNLVHLVLIFALIFFYLVQKPRDRNVGIYVLLIISAFLLFSGYLKWQPWNSRLQLPLFVLFTPFLGVMLARIASSKIVVLIFVILLVNSIPFLFTDEARPLIGHEIDIGYTIKHREEQYFNNYTEMRESYFKAAKYLDTLDCSHVGLIIGPDSYEYPLWMLLRRKADHPVWIEHVNVTNLSKRLVSSSEPIALCALFTVNPKNSAIPRKISVNNTVYANYWTSGKKKFESVNIYIPNTARP